jgi:hypothetical protein
MYEHAHPDRLQMDCSQTTFFSLPRELRDIIYDHIWQSPTTIAFYQRPSLPSTAEEHLHNRSWLGLLMVIQYERRGRFTKHYRNAWKPTHEPLRRPTWIWTCRQMYHEATEHFYRHAQLTDCRYVHRVKLGDAENLGQSRGAQRIACNDENRFAYGFPLVSGVRRVAIVLRARQTLQYASVCKTNDRLALFLEFLCKVKTDRNKRVLVVHVRKNTRTDRDQTSGGLLKSCFSTSFEETRMQELKHRGWTIVVKYEKGADVVKFLRLCRNIVRS